MCKVTGCQWIMDLGCWIFPEVTIFDADHKECSLGEWGWWLCESLARVPFFTGMFLSQGLFWWILQRVYSWGRVLFKVLYGESKLQGLTLKRFVYDCIPFVYPKLKKGTLLIYFHNWPILCINYQNGSPLVIFMPSKLNDTAIWCICVKVLIKSPLKELNGRFPYVFTYLNLWNLLPYIPEV